MARRMAITVAMMITIGNDDGDDNDSNPDDHYPANGGDNPESGGVGGNPESPSGEPEGNDGQNDGHNGTTSNCHVMGDYEYTQRKAVKRNSR